jgi:hypothetical protein
MLAFKEANPTVKQTEIGQALATAEGRERPYDGSWVSRALKTAKAYPEPPKPGTDSAAFNRSFYGHDGRAKKAEAKGPATAETYISAAVKNAVKAFELGSTGAEILAAVEAGINAAVKARDSVPAADPHANAALAELADLRAQLAALKAA